MEFPLFDVDDDGDVDDVDGVDGEVEPFCPGLYPRRPAAAQAKNRRALAAPAEKIYKNSNRKFSSCKRKSGLHFNKKV